MNMIKEYFKYLWVGLLNSWFYFTLFLTCFFDAFLPFFKLNDKAWETIYNREERKGIENFVRNCPVKFWKDVISAPRSVEISTQKRGEIYLVDEESL